VSEYQLREPAGAASARDHGLVSLNCPSVIPFQCLNARWNAEGSENPVSAAISWIVRFGSLSICVARILIDEIGHVSFQRLAMGRAGLALTKALLPIVALGLASSTARAGTATRAARRSAIPEVRALGAIPRAPVEGITALARGGLPETVRRNAFFA
jgi:hypothetical protein